MYFCCFCLCSFIFFNFQGGEGGLFLFVKSQKFKATRNPNHLQRGKRGKKTLNKVNPRCHRWEGQRQDRKPGLLTQSSLFSSRPPCLLLVCTEAAESGKAPSTEVWPQLVFSHCHRILQLRRMLALMQSIILFSGTDVGGKAQRSQAKPVWEPHGLLGASQLTPSPVLPSPGANSLGT